MPEAALYPGARWYPLGAQTETRMRSHDIVCLHTMVGYLASTDPYFRVTNGAGFAGTESHFGVGGKWGRDVPASGGSLDGVTWQWQDLAYGADANLDGKTRVISIETADNAPARPEDIEAWTDRQVEEIVRLVDWLCSPAAHAKCPAGWLCRDAGIPRVLIPDSKPGRRGIGYHAQGAAERVAGGERWSTSSTKPCPGARRIAQLRNVIVPRVASRAVGAIVEDDMFGPADSERLVRVERYAAQVATKGMAALARLDADRPVDAGKLAQILTAITAAGVEAGKRDAAVLTALSLISVPDPDAFAAALAPLLEREGVLLDVATIARAVRLDLADHLTDPAA